MRLIPSAPAQPRRTHAGEPTPVGTGLQLNGWCPPSERGLGSDVQIADALFESLAIRGLDRNDCTITVDHGVVILEGDVPDAGERALMERTVREAPGVHRIESRLRAGAWRPGRDTHAA